MTMKKTALITGATSGIGEACARKFAAGGYNLIITGRRADRLEEIKTTLEAMGAEVVTLAFDVRDAEAATKAIASLGEGWQEIDVLINNAGLALGLDKEYEGDPTDWNTMIDTNIKGLLTMTRLVVPGMVARNRRRRLRLRQRVLCHQSSREGPHRRSAYRRGPHGCTRDQREARTGGDKLQPRALPW